ncbi:MAG: right-handed parallel beta-helix repeat-containing protein [Halorientalis sp.]
MSSTRRTERRSAPPPGRPRRRWLVALLVVVLLAVAPAVATAQDEDEPNDRRGSATTVELGERVNAALALSDTDWYAFEVERPGTVQVDFQRLGAADVRVVGPRGPVLETTGPLPRRIGLSVDRPGTYYLRVATVADASGGYAFTVDLDTRNRGSKGVTPLDSCTVITEPGRYELTDDVRTDAGGVCIHVRADDVVLDGNGHTVAGGGVEDSVGLLVYNGSRREGVDREDTISNVTVRDLTVTNWHDGVHVGDVAGIGTRASLVDVTVRDNRNLGVYLVEVEGATVEGVTATGNRHGVVLWEAYDVRATDVAVRENGRWGLTLGQNVGRSTFTRVESRSNAGFGISLSDDVVNNTIARSVVADNGQAGIRFADSTGNAVEATRVEDNAGPGILLNPGGGEAVTNVTVRGNGGPALDVSEGELASADLVLGPAGTARVLTDGQDVGYGATPFRVDTAPTETLDDPPGRPLVTEAVNASGLRSDLRVAFAYDERDVDRDDVALWRYDGSEWRRVDDARVTETSVSGDVAADGVVVPLATDGEAADGTGVTGDDDVLEVLSTADNQFDYEVVVRGTAEPSSTDEVSADDEDRVRENDDGTVTIDGSTGDNSGDAYRVTGEILGIEISGVDSGYRIEVDDRNVTDRAVEADLPVRTPNTIP